MTDGLARRVNEWVLDARQRITEATFGERDLDRLLLLVRRRPFVRQELLYLHAATPTIHAPVVAETYHPAQPGPEAEVEAVPRPRRYGTVHQAILDGWWVVHFPQQRLSGALDVIGYEFILERQDA